MILLIGRISPFGVEKSRQKGGIQMYKVKLFDEGRVKELQKEINTFLENVSGESSFELIDIKFSSYNYGEDRREYFSALVIYKV